MDEAWRQIGKGGDKLIPVFANDADREDLEEEIRNFAAIFFIVTTCPDPAFCASA
jgi:hypothetical protein